MQPQKRDEQRVSAKSQAASLTEAELGGSYPSLKKFPTDFDIALVFPHGPLSSRMMSVNPMAGGHYFEKSTFFNDTGRTWGSMIRHDRDFNEFGIVSFDLKKLCRLSYNLL